VGNLCCASFLIVVHECLCFQELLQLVGFVVRSVERAISISPFESYRVAVGGSVRKALFGLGASFCSGLFAFRFVCCGAFDVVHRVGSPNVSAGARAHICLEVVQNSNSCDCWFSEVLRGRGVQAQFNGPEFRVWGGEYRSREAASGPPGWPSKGKACQSGVTGSS
jgi:hypothetical protein